MIDLIRESETKKRFCILPFNSVQINQTQVMPCCKMGAVEIKDGSWKETMVRYFDNAQLKQMQELFLSSQVPRECSKCFSAGEIALYPHQKLLEYQKMIEASEVDAILSDGTTPQILNVILTNACNLRCRHCAPTCSSSINSVWNDELAKITSANKTKPFNSDELIDELLAFDKFHSVRNVLLSGGEPLMLKRLYDITKKFKDSGCRKIGVVTNLSNDPFGYLPKLNEIGKSIYASLTVSIDGDRPMHEYHRNLLDIDKFEANVNSLGELEHIVLSVMIAVDAINVLSFTKLIDYIFAIFPRAPIFQLSIVENSYLCMKVLPTELKKMALTRITEYVENFPHHDKCNASSALLRLEQVKNLLESSIVFDESVINPNHAYAIRQQSKFRSFIEYLVLLDKMYGTDFREVLPELLPYCAASQPQ